ncbi:MAG: hypothetical protein AUI11_00120 [Acidobacteria bacterium 13_2_20CM_2_66_4]|nr:MAG: hypothetical protein AUI11_00120 [Acidobacteria bacterium 13_2_20CM_2_66_4]
MSIVELAVAPLLAAALASLSFVALSALTTLAGLIPVLLLIALVGSSSTFWILWILPPLLLAALLSALAGILILLVHTVSSRDAARRMPDARSAPFDSERPTAYAQRRAALPVVGLQVIS